MERSRKNKLFIIFALVISIASLSIGFAAFSVSLNISSQASVSPSSDTFSVKFSTNKDSVYIAPVIPLASSSGTTFTEGVIDNSGHPKITSLSATFTAPGQSVTYRVFARNEGEYDAYLNSINFIGNKTCVGEAETSDSLVQSACASIKTSVVVAGTTYNETTSVTGHVLAKTAGESIVITLEYASDGSYVDGPFSVTFSDIALVYSTVDNTAIAPTILRVESGDINTLGSIVSIGNEQFYVYGQENGNVKLLSMYNLYVGNILNKADNYSLITISSPTGIQDSSAKGYYYNESLFVGTVPFSKTDNTYLDSVIEEYVNNYKDYLIGLNSTIYDVRLITKDELEFLGCSGDAGSCNSAPSWVYATSYWSGTIADSETVWTVSSLTGFDKRIYNDKRSCGVRPVVEIPLSEF